MSPAIVVKVIYENKMLFLRYESHEAMKSILIKQLKLTMNQEDLAFYIPAEKQINTSDNSYSKELHPYILVDHMGLYLLGQDESIEAEFQPIYIRIRETDQGTIS